MKTKFKNLAVALLLIATLCVVYGWKPAPRDTRVICLEAETKCPVKEFRVTVTKYRWVGFLCYEYLDGWTEVGKSAPCIVVEAGLFYCFTAGVYFQNGNECKVHPDWENRMIDMYGKGVDKLKVKLSEECDCNSLSGGIKGIAIALQWSAGKWVKAVS